jgi:DNA-3-methyladenine glycosylase I
MNLATHPDGLHRCPWCGTDPLYVAYHDTDWGVPEYDSRALFEKLILDGFQAGLAWITILRKRENFRAAFHGFEPERIARYTDADVARLMADAGIVRNRAKVEGTILGARAYLAMRDQGLDFSQHLWSFVDGRPVQSNLMPGGPLVTQTAVSKAISKDLAGRGFKFVGPTIVYAFMQAVGMVNDHLVGCHRHQAVQALAR